MNSYFYMASLDIGGTSSDSLQNVIFFSSIVNQTVRSVLKESPK